VALCDRLLESMQGGARAGVLLGSRGLAEAAEALWRITGAPLVVPREPARHDPYDFVSDYRRWTSYFAEARLRFDPELRYRFGEPHSALHAVAELERDDVPTHIRHACALELAVRLGERPLLLHDFATRQASVLAAQRASVEAAIGGGDVRFAAGRRLG
jgi:hypothetical protein